MKARYAYTRNYGCRVWEFVFQGMNVVVLENEVLRIGILADKGTDIYEFLYKPTDTDFMWRSWLGIRDPHLVQPTLSSRLGSFLDHYFGGWQELFPSGDEPCTYKGAEIGVHGEVCLMPWTYEVVRDDPEEIQIRFRVHTYRTPFCIEKTLTLKSGRPTLHVHECVTNMSQEEMDFMWGQHPALGSPFLDEQCVISVPKCRVRTDEVLRTPWSRIAPNQDTEWPIVKDDNGVEIDLSKIPPIAARRNDRVALYDMAESWYAVTNTARKIGFGMWFQKEVFPYLLYWQSFGGWEGYPFYRTAYTMALEPRSSFPFPLTQVIDAGTQLKLAPGESLEANFTAVAYENCEGVRHITPDGSVVPE
jgi:hypothetical protein